MEIIFLWFIFAGVAALIATNKGRSGIGFFALSVVLSPLVGIIIALCVNPDTAAQESSKLATGNNRKCPFCAEIVKADAIVCRYCKHDLPVELRKSDKLSSWQG